MFRELLSLPGRLLRPSTVVASDAVDSLTGSDVAGDLEDVVSPVTDTVGEVASEVGGFVGGVADEVLGIFDW